MMKAFAADGSWISFEGYLSNTGLFGMEGSPHAADKGIIHAQIESQGVIAFAAYDNFHRDCVLVTGREPRSVLDDLVTARDLWDYAATTK